MHKGIHVAGGIRRAGENEARLLRVARREEGDGVSARGDGGEGDAFEGFGVAVAEDVDDDDEFGRVAGGFAMCGAVGGGSISRAGVVCGGVDEGFGFGARGEFLERAEAALQRLEFVLEAGSGGGCIVAGDAEVGGNLARRRVGAAVVGEGAGAGDELDARHAFGAFPRACRDEADFAGAPRVRAAAGVHIETFDFDEAQIASTR